MNKLIDALVALCESIPGVKSTTVSTYSVHRSSVLFSTESDQAAVDLAAAFGLETAPKSYEGKRWIGADGEIGTVRVSLYGPHIDAPEPQEISTKRIDAAIALAEEVMRTGAAQ